MKILVLGSTGMIGAQLVTELGARGHHVVSAVRSGTQPDPDRTDTATVQVDPRSARSITAAGAGADVIVSALGGTRTGDPQLVVDAAAALLQAAEHTGARLAVVGGAGSLRTADGRRLIDGADFPDAWKPASMAQIDALAVYQSYRGDASWTYLSPSDVIEPGTRTGKVVLGGEELLTDANGRSYVSVEDFAFALADEVEIPAHERQRFTVRSA